MKMFWETLNKTSLLIGLASSIVTIIVPTIWFAATLDARIKTLEAQITAIALTTNVKNEDTNSSKETINPIEKSCADLALKAAGLEEKREWVASNGIKDLIAKLGCHSK